jgi:hypothetical protein
MVHVLFCLKKTNFFFISNVKAHKITNEMLNIDWENQTCNEIECMYRAFNEFVS